MQKFINVSIAALGQVFFFLSFLNAQINHYTILGTDAKLFADYEERMMLPIHNQLKKNTTDSGMVSLAGWSENTAFGAGVSTQWSFLQLHLNQSKFSLDKINRQEENLIFSATPKYKNFFLSGLGQWQKQRLKLPEISYHFQQWDGAIAAGAIFSHFYLSFFKHGFITQNKKYQTKHLTTDTLPIYYHNGYSFVSHFRVKNLLTGMRLHFVKQYEITDNNQHQIENIKPWQGNVYTGIFLSPQFFFSAGYNFSDHGFNINMEWAFNHSRINYRFTQNTKQEQLHQISISYHFLSTSSHFTFFDGPNKREHYKDNRIAHWEKRSHFFEERYQLMREQYFNRMRELYDQRQAYLEKWKKKKYRKQYAQNKAQKTISLTGLVDAGILPDRAIEIFRLWSKGKSIAQISSELALTAAEKKILQKFRG